MFSSKPNNKVNGSGKPKGNQEIRRVQEEALNSLPPQTLYIVMFTRNSPPVPGNFHWNFYYHRGGGRPGNKYNVKDIGADATWIADHAPSSSVFKSQFLCVLVRIASIPEDKEALLDRVARSFDDRLNQIEGMRCRLWTFLVVEQLVKNGLVHCEDVDALREECVAVGNERQDDADRNVQPRPVVVSALAH